MLNTLECPVCLDTCDSSPIYQCPEGHLLCQRCNQRLVDCPQCGHALVNSRNRTAEDLAVKLQVNVISLDLPVTKNQILNTKCQLIIFCCFKLKREETWLFSSLFKLRWQQKTLAEIWCLVFSHQSIQWKEQKLL